MSFIGGDIKEITVNHPSLGSFTIYPKSNEDSTIREGGFVSNDDNEMVTASGQMIDQLNNTRWSVETVVAWGANSNLELSNLQALQSSPELGDWTFAHVSGQIWAGKGKPVGDLEGSGNNATITLKVAGGGKLTKLA